MRQVKPSPADSRLAQDEIDEVDEMNQIDESGSLDFGGALNMEQRRAPVVQQKQANPGPPDSGTREGGKAHNRAALKRALERAEVSKAELLKSPEMLSGEDLGKELGLSRTTIDNRRVEGKLLALEFGSKRGFRYPRWQREFLEERSTREQFEAVLEHLKSVGAWSRYRFFTQSAPALNGKTPLEALHAGAADRVLAAADTWARGEGRAGRGVRSDDC